MSWMVPNRLPQDGPEPILGAGVSRPKPNESVRNYKLEVKRPGYRAMTITIPAPSKAKAKIYCQNRWPDANVTHLQ